MKSSEFIETSSQSRRKLLALNIAAICLGGVFVLLRPLLFAHIEQLPACGQARWSLELLIGSFGLLPIASLFAGNYARKLLKHGQFPLPGAWVWRRTPVTRGRTVQLRAYGILSCSVALFAAFFYGWYALWPMATAIFQRCSP